MRAGDSFDPTDPAFVAARHPDRLSANEVGAASMLLVNAGHEATVNVIGANRDPRAFGVPDELDVSRAAS